ncbi:Phosphotransferase enzyme family protein [Legionella birminghamensis]|uniref:Phosphotransferase enzyme family n=1 Tax=Legionella birminghamensis TaxID=28083 RepID=A0A378IAT5_9GAMM|nr:aminoglycoside phosphotransferase family protein [Legionella birminghamensis]KTC69397.1 Phosphotransferase enzyme family protein [Legionella birminghamensis]STX31661.1 Phosphotransferase enzyme family [Legionella birminghamensis]
MTQLEGTLLEELWHAMDHDNKLVIIKELGSLLREVHTLPTQGLESIDGQWKSFIRSQITSCVAHHRTKGLPTSLLKQIPSYIESVNESLLQIEKPVILTGEYTPMNFLVTNTDGTWHITGLIDFGDAMLGHYKYDLLGPGAFLIQGDKELLQTFLRAYGFRVDKLNGELSQQLTALMLLHKYSNLEIQIRIASILYEKTRKFSLGILIYRVDYAPCKPLVLVLPVNCGKSYPKSKTALNYRCFYFI